MKIQWPDIDKIHLYVKHLFQSKYQSLIKGRGKVGIKKLKNPKGFIDYSQTIDDLYEKLENCNPSKKRRMLILFDDSTSDMIANRELSPIATEWFLRGRKVNISHVFSILFQCA